MKPERAFCISYYWSCGTWIVYFNEQLFDFLFIWLNSSRFRTLNPRCYDLQERWLGVEV